MILKNKSNYVIIAKKRIKRSIKNDPNFYDILLCKKSKHNKNFVIEKLGFIDYKHKKFCLNNFRFIFWMQFNVSFSTKAWFIMQKYFYVLNSVKIKT